MLKSLTVSNFKAFANPVTIDFSKTGNYEFNQEAIKNDIVKTALIYGKNASGKSSIGLAIFDIVANLTDNFVDIKNYINYKNLINDSPFVSFDYKFIFQNTEIEYSYIKTDIRIIVAEKLGIGKKTVIEYDKRKPDTLLAINMKGAENINVDLSQLNFSALRFVKANVILAENEENSIFYEFYNFVDKMLLFWSLETREFIGFTPVSGKEIIPEIIKKGHFEDLQRFFKEAGIEDELTHRNINGREQLLINFNGKYMDFGLASSSGMSSLLLLYYWLEDISDCKKCPSLVFIDEFDAFYHYELSVFIIDRLKKANCQVILSTHNTAMFSNDILRPDCYYICSKNKIENAHSSTPKEIRFGNNLEKLYKGGTFGK